MNQYPTLILILCRFPPVFHDWFIETFPEPSAWLASRLAYGRTAAVMSMVGFILGLVVFFSFRSSFSLDDVFITTDLGIDIWRTFYWIRTLVMWSMLTLIVSLRKYVV